MLDRVAIGVASLRTVCAALLALVLAVIATPRVDGLAAITWPAPAATVHQAPCTYRTLRTRASGLHQRYMMRDVVARRPLLTLDD